jgi:hypothetical protein
MKMLRTKSSIAVTQPHSWQTRPGRFAGEWQGGASGAKICVIANLIEEMGAGIGLHKHPYAETLVVRKGSVSFTIGTKRNRSNALRNAFKEWCVDRGYTRMTSTLT